MKRYKSPVPANGWYVSAKIVKIFQSHSLEKVTMRKGYRITVADSVQQTLQVSCEVVAGPYS